MSLLLISCFYFIYLSLNSSRICLCDVWKGQTPSPGEGFPTPGKGPHPGEGSPPQDPGKGSPPLGKASPPQDLREDVSF